MAAGGCGAHRHSYVTDVGNHKQKEGATFSPSLQDVVHKNGNSTESKAVLEIFES